MRKRWIVFLSAVVLTNSLSIQATAQTVSPLEVKELTLSNGMRVWLNEDHSQPKVFGAVVVNAGAKDCPDTGIAHYFEHIMFKGTDQIGTIDYEQEKPWLDSIAAAYDRLALTHDATQRATIQRDINRLSQRAAEYAIPNEFNGLISRYGGSHLNAGTSYDFTFYHNMFTPQYIEHWCLLNSDRLIHPVFRLFQGELETVYEEKNMASDNMVSQVQEHVMRELFGTQPYAYPIIGSTENLKNPKLSDMTAFYEQYYVGCNMGLVLSGDIDAEDIVSLLERTFGRIPRGVEPKRQTSPLPDITCERTVEAQLPVPLVSMEALVFKAPTSFDPDANAVEIATRLLSNEQTGLLDSLQTDGQLMMGQMATLSLRDAGVAMLIVVPNLLAKTQKAEEACLAQVRRIMAGDFSDKALQVLKQEAYRDAYRALETIDGRAMQMVEVMAAGRSWQDYLDKVRALQTLTRQEVQEAAHRCFSAPFVRLKKKYGTYAKDHVSQPGYTPVVARNRSEESDYARRLAAVEVAQRSPRLMDFGHDATTIPLGGEATLYTVKNPVNDLFQLTLTYNCGKKADPRLEAACDLLNVSGTDSLSRQQWAAALQDYGATLTFSSDDDNFVMIVTGVDQHFDSTLRLVGHFIQHVLPNDKALANMKDAVRAEEKSLAKENTGVLRALMAKVAYGQQSQYLRRLTYRQAKRLRGEDLIAAYRAVQGCACHIVYSGTLDDQQVERQIRQALPVERSRKPYVDYGTDYIGYDQPMVYVFDMRKARQTLIFTYDTLPPSPTREARIPAILLSQYLGGSMSSVLFQEVREFRSMAYSVGSQLQKRPFSVSPRSPMALVSVTGTQGDKAMNVIALVDSLLADMPVLEKNFRDVRQECVNAIDNNYPSFRDLGTVIAADRQIGYQEDPNKGVAELYGQTTIDDMLAYYSAHVKGNAPHRVIGIVGNRKSLDLKALARYGRVVVVKEKDLFRK